MSLSNRYLTADGKAVIPYSNADQYWAKNTAIVALFEEAIGDLEIPEGTQNHAFEIDMGRPIGTATLVETAPVALDEIMGSFVQRPGRKGPSRVVVLEGSAQKISTLVVVVAQRFNWEEDEKVYVDGEYMLKTVYVGTVTPNEPCNTRPNTPQRQQSLDFWCRHALVWTPSMGDTFSSSWETILQEHDAQQAAC